MSRVQLWAAEQDDEDLGEVDVGLAIGSYGQQELQPRFDEAAFALLQHQMAQQQAQLAAIPDAVKRFLLGFHRAVREHNVAEISAAYDGGWNKLTEKYYAKTEWPDAELVAPLVGDDPLFLILYRELYYRHVYSRLSPEPDDRFHSYENSCELFNFLLNSDGPVPLELPDQWLWDIIDEFIYQFQSFCLWRAKARAAAAIDDDPALAQTWSTYSVLNVLYSFVQKSRINEYLDAVRAGKSEEEINEIVGEYGQRPLYRMLGYFSLVGLLRVHVLLGDYTLALSVVDHLDLGQKSMLSRVTACHVATYYYVGFCYFVLRRYADATRVFAGVLNFVGRMRQYHTRSYQYDQINKTADRMYALFALAVALAPGARPDDTALAGARERFGEQTARMARGEPAAFDELFAYACPKFIAPDGAGGAWDHQALFREEVKAQLGAGTLRGFLKMYKTVDVRKMAAFLDADFAAAAQAAGDSVEEEVLMEMMVLKQASRSISRLPGDAGSLLDGESVCTSDLDFVIDENIVHVAESTVGRRYAGWFIRNAEAAERAYDGVRALPVPGFKPVPVVAAK